MKVASIALITLLAACQSSGGDIISRVKANAPDYGGEIQGVYLAESGLALKLAANPCAVKMEILGLARTGRISTAEDINILLFIFKRLPTRDMIEVQRAQLKYLVEHKLSLDSSMLLILPAFEDRPDFLVRYESQPEVKKYFRDVKELVLSHYSANAAAKNLAGKWAEAEFIDGVEENIRMQGREKILENLPSVSCNL